ncbi:MAG: signal peptidase II [Ilumatobacter sp.]|uniref:signal peptidase II n=1 Tax=Ilumatobacter sp. TaxID=1967498 RepID=UPI0039196D6F
MNPVRAWRGPVLLAIVIVALDQLTKHWALNELADGRDIHVIWTLQFNLAFNSGMAFSAAQGFGPVIAVVATIVIVWLLIALRGVGGRLATFGMGCVIGGAAGNLVDRMFRGDAWLRGAVVDFIDFQWFPIFNIADMAINFGAGALILNAVLTSRRENAEIAASPQADAPTEEPADASTDGPADSSTDGPADASTEGST